MLGYSWIIIVAFLVTVVNGDYKYASFSLRLIGQSVGKV
jgi:hypothetical protein